MTETAANTLPPSFSSQATNGENGSRDQASQLPPTQETNQAESIGPQPETLVLEWRAPSRLYKKRNRQYYVTIGLIVFLISLILFFAGQFLPIAVVISIAFVAYVFSSVPPQMIVNQITTYGIRTEGNLYHWEEMGRFWSEDKYGQKLVYVEISRFPSRLTLLLGDQDWADIQSLLAMILLNEKPPLTTFDKAAKWLQEKIPLDVEA